MLEVLASGDASEWSFRTAGVYSEGRGTGGIYFVDTYVEIKGRSLLSPSWLGLQGHLRILQLKSGLGTRVRAASSF